MLERLMFRVSVTAHALAEEVEKDIDRSGLDQVRPSGVQGASVFFSSSQREMELADSAVVSALEAGAVVAWA